MNILNLLGRSEPLFDAEVRRFEAELSELARGGRFLVIGGAGSIGQAVVREIFQRSPRALHVVDLNENNLVELVRDLRSTLGYIDGDFRTFAIDCDSREFRALLRWTKDPFSSRSNKRSRQPAPGILKGGSSNQRARCCGSR